MYCPNCDSEVESTVRVISETYPVKGEDVTVAARVRFCNCCGKVLWDEELDSKNLLDAFDVYREKHNLLQPAEIRTIREKYCLSQVAFARVLGLGDKTIARYENGSIPDSAQNNLIDLVQHPSNFKKLLEKNKDKISEQDYDSATAALEALRPRIIYRDQAPAHLTSPDGSITYYTTPQFWGDLNYAKSKRPAVS